MCISQYEQDSDAPYQWAAFSFTHKDVVNK